MYKRCKNLKASDKDNVIGVVAVYETNEVPCTDESEYKDEDVFPTKWAIKFKSRMNTVYAIYSEGQYTFFVYHHLNRVKIDFIKVDPDGEDDPLKF